MFKYSTDAQTPSYFCYPGSNPEYKYMYGNDLRSRLEGSSMKGAQYLEKRK